MSRARDIADLAGSADAGGLTGRNLIINGNMSAAQRGTTATDVSNIGTVDRWHHQFLGGGITATQESLSSSDTPYSLGFRNYLRMNNDTSTSGAGDVRQIYQTIEAQNIANSGWNYTSASSYITLSLWVRTSLAGKYRIGITSDDGTAQMFNFTETLVANTWTKITKTIPGNSNLTVNNDNGAGLTVAASLWLGTNYTDDTSVLDAWTANDGTKSAPTDIADWGGTSNATFDITGVQLEVGTTATDFEHEDYGTTLEKCQRYFFKSGQMWMSGYSYGVNNSADGFVVPVFWPTAMRKVNPSVTFSGGSDGGSGAALFTAYVQEEGMSINLRSTNAGTNVWWSGFIISADAEL